MEQIIQPFVFRKYLDFGAYESMRALHAQIRQEVNRREMHENIKLGPGGIREVEFIAQVFQLIRGGRDIDLRIQPTLSVLSVWGKSSICRTRPPLSCRPRIAFCAILNIACSILMISKPRRYQKIHADQTLIARSMGFSGYEEFLRRLDSHRGNVTRHFEKIFSLPRSKAPDMLAWLWQGERRGWRNRGRGHLHATRHNGFLPSKKYTGPLERIS